MAIEYLPHDATRYAILPRCYGHARCALLFTRYVRQRRASARCARYAQHMLVARLIRRATMPAIYAAAITLRYAYDAIAAAATLRRRYALIAVILRHDATLLLPRYSRMLLRCQRRMFAAHAEMPLRHDVVAAPATRRVTCERQMPDCARCFAAR